MDNAELRELAENLRQHAITSFPFGGVLPPDVRQDLLDAADAIAAALPPAPGVGEAVSDSRRMDWLEANAMAVIVDHTFVPWTPPNIPATRAAIDAAMSRHSGTDTDSRQEDGR
jgi:hypothetical protein